MVSRIGRNCDFTGIELLPASPNFGSMKPSEIFRENAENCAQLAASEPTEDGPAYKRYKRMQAAWQALAEEQEWLDGEVPPLSSATR
jgi:hypothetical protein